MEFKATFCYAGAVGPYVAVGVHTAYDSDWGDSNWGDIATMVLKGSRWSDGDDIVRSYFARSKDPALALIEFQAYYTGAYHRGRFEVIA
jgi:hypothetical protein